MIAPRSEIFHFLALFVLCLPAYPADDARLTNRSSPGVEELAISDPICGLACLKVAFALYGTNVDLQKLAEHAPPHPEGASIADLVKASKNSGFHAEPFRKKTAGLPSLFENGDDLLVLRTRKEGEDGPFPHYVLLMKRADDRYLLVDPYEAPVVCDVAHMDKIFLGDGLRLSNHSPRVRLSIVEALLALAFGYIGGFILLSPKRRLFGGMA